MRCSRCVPSWLLAITFLVSSHVALGQDFAPAPLPFPPLPEPYVEPYYEPSSEPFVEPTIQPHVEAPPGPFLEPPIAPLPQDDRFVPFAPELAEPWREDDYVDGDYVDLPRATLPAVDVERGSRRPIIDGLGWIIGIPRKLLLWDSRADNHDISGETTEDIAAYLADNQLTDIKVRVNQYAPLEEWRRLVANKRVGAGWRYTFGLLKQVEYTLLPGRIFGGDEYNPYTHSLYVYSDVPALGLAESAYAKDVRARQYPGTYATVQTLPIIAMWHETLATQEVLQYVALRGAPEEIAATRRILYARYGMELGGELDSVVSPSGVRVGGIYQVVGAVGGHVAAGVENLRDTPRR